ncbi:MAG: hypothetical protein FJZ01_04925 [Candidatus Sericytochromatia bacterium]|nr:hypothetical protein [Candidatus Tanganyikabacteria bacterium]
MNPVIPRTPVEMPPPRRMTAISRLINVVGGAFGAAFNLPPALLGFRRNQLDLSRAWTDIKSGWAGYRLPYHAADDPARVSDAAQRARQAQGAE